MVAILSSTSNPRNGVAFAAGDNIVLDPISHGANVWPWVQLAKSNGVEIRWLPTHQDNGCKSLEHVMNRQEIC